MKKYFVFYLLLFSNLVLADTNLKPLAISIPKSGSHLLTKCINLIIKEKNGSRFHHIRFSLSELGWIKTKGYNKLFFMYRDPRDQIISLIFHVKERIKEAGNNKEKLDKINKLLIYKDLSIEETINKLIYEGSAYYDFYSGARSSTNGIKEFYDSFYGWKSLKNVCAVSFEDLVGPKGGGKSITQLATIKRIVKHLSIDLSNDEIINVADNLFGAKVFFRKGQIGDWKNYFTKQNKINFKKATGSLLIDWGYEKNLNW